MADKNVEGAQPSRKQSEQSAQAQPGEATARRSGEQQGQQQSRALQRRSSAPLAGAFGLSPFSLVRRMMEDMDRMFEGLGGGRGGFVQVWSPPIEILERSGRIVVRAELPGLSPDDVRIEVRDDALLLEGERKSEMEVEEQGGVYRSERTYGRFSREIPLPEAADIEKPQARFENGVLEIEVPLREEASRRRRIEIQGGSRRPGSDEPAVH